MQDSYIRAQLQAVEKLHDVRVLMAVESGSRLWGFPSLDSDYDVRFIYAHKVSYYLKVQPTRDVIEIPIADDDRLGAELDISGWDIRKALQLAAQSNRAMLEWVQSPLIYVETPFYTELRDYALSCANLPAMHKHYLGWTRKQWADVGSREAVPAKVYCHALRTALAADYIVRRGAVPPPDMSGLLASHPQAAILQPLWGELERFKALQAEQATTWRVDAFDNLIHDVIASDVMEEVETPHLPEMAARADGIFTRAIGFDPMD